MNILIVDDQANVISSLKSGIDWQSLRIGNVYTALDALEARECILSHDIDILLTDIEMPVENGLSLVRWCRQNGYDFECIFLTSHADFFYAQEAIQLGSFDYLLQPARYEDIQNTIQKTIQRIMEKRQNQEFLKYGRAAISQKNHLLKGIFDDILAGKDADIQEILSIMKEMELPITPDSPVYLLQMDILGWRSVPLSFSEWNEQSAGVLDYVFSHTGCHVLSWCPSKVSMIALIYSTNSASIVSELYRSRINLAYTQLTRRLGCKCAIYTAAAPCFAQFQKCADNIRQIRFNNVAQNGGIFYFSEKAASSEVVRCGEEMLERFTLYMTGHQAQRAEQEALLHLHKLNMEARLCFDTLQFFCRDYQQAAYHAAKKLKLPLHSMPSYEELFHPFGSQILTLEAVSGYIKQLTAFFSSQITENQSSEDLFSKIDAYIQSNLDKSLLCADVAKAVYLSPDYITRIVQKEKGMSLKEYITHAKMQSARNMLITTKLPVSLIAAKVGYNNFSHFSKVYKKVIGKIPSAER